MEKSHNSLTLSFSKSFRYNRPCHLVGDTSEKSRCFSGKLLIGSVPTLVTGISGCRFQENYQIEQSWSMAYRKVLAWAISYSLFMRVHYLMLLSTIFLKLMDMLTITRFIFLSKASDQTTQEEALQAIQNCVNDVRKWI